MPDPSWTWRLATLAYDVDADGHIQAAQVPYDPTASSMAADNVQAAIEELAAAAAATLDPAEVRDAGRWEIVMTPGITDPPEPVWTPDGTDFVYAWVTD